jgi:hypothetical protein
MDWATPVSTLIGAIVGVGSTLLVESVRAKRDRGDQLYQTRRQLYARYLEALTTTDSELQLLAVSQQTPANQADLRAAWRSHSLLALRYEIELVAPARVAGAAQDAYKCLRAARNVIGNTEVTVKNPCTPDDSNPRSAAWQRVQVPYIDAVTALRSVMRADMASHQEH